MFRRNDPRIRRTLNQLTQNLESANESAQANLFSFDQHYVRPCLVSLSECFAACTEPCFSSRDDHRHRRHRARGGRGRAEFAFDFYDDWEAEENDALLGWGNEEFDRLLGGQEHSTGSGGYGATTSAAAQPGRQRGMSYGRHDAAGRRKSAVQPHDGGPDPTIIPNTSYFGFLGRLPWKIGGKGLRYKPSAADLQEHPGMGRRALQEREPLVEDSDEEAAAAGGHGGGKRGGHSRNRSGTTTSGHTTDSLSSRGDIFPSEDELDDAQPLDDSFAVALERRGTNVLSSDDNASGKTPRSRTSAARTASRSTRASSGKHGSGGAGGSAHSVSSQDKHAESGVLVDSVPSLADLRSEEDRLRADEEQAIRQKRAAARKLAAERGLDSSGNPPPPPPADAEPTSPAPRSSSSRSGAGAEERAASPVVVASPMSENPASVEPVVPVPPGAPAQPAHEVEDQNVFVPAKLPRFQRSPD
ncbi:hypothetical protein BDY21DRAFT_290390 [Lineolata rhizophorae]|uniref:Uncharacterized protein n=1 Tax=Lineolata rhizophorae TaxID=578093 RepID=A0A6A6NT51_9PEZI|nr:hypothetical protein BDY21DRAFT_290390 [Lineolata rhizophorae]